VPAAANADAASAGGQRPALEAVRFARDDLYSLMGKAYDWWRTNLLCGWDFLCRKIKRWEARVAMKEQRNAAKMEDGRWKMVRNEDSGRTSNFNAERPPSKRRNRRQRR